MSDKDLNYITETLLKSYPNSSIINEEYLNNLLNKLQEENLSDVSQTIFTCKSMINNYLIAMAKKDENVLLELVVDMASVKDRICLKLKLDKNNPLYDEYLMEGILAYDGSKNLELYLSSFLLKKLKMKYVPEKTDKKLVFKGQNNSLLKEENITTEEIKEVAKQEIVEPIKVVEVTPVVVEEVKQDILEKEKAIKEPSREDIVEPIQSQNSSEPLILSKKQLKNKKRREAKKEQEETQIENTFEIPIEDLENILNHEETEEQELEDITKDFYEPLIEERLSEEEISLKVEQVLAIKGTEKENLVSKLYHFLEAEKNIKIEDNIYYDYYCRLRFNKDNRYSLEVIASTLNLSLKEVIGFEEYTIKELKELLNKPLEKNISLTVK